MTHDQQTYKKLEPDSWTVTNMVAEGTTSFASDFYWLSSFFDVITGCKAQVIGLSWPGFAVGLMLALFSTSGLAYSHLMLNILHQNLPEQAEERDEIDLEAQSPLSHAFLTDSQEQRIVSSSSSNYHPISLTLFQKLALFGAWVAHAGDIVGPIVFVVYLATDNSLPRSGKIALHCGATVFGCFGSFANVRTCRDAMLTLNKTK